MNVVPFGLPLGASASFMPFATGPGFSLAVDAAIGAPATGQAASGGPVALLTPELGDPVPAEIPAPEPALRRPTGTAVAMLIAVTQPDAPATPQSGLLHRRAAWLGATTPVPTPIGGSRQTAALVEAAMSTDAVAAAPAGATQPAPPLGDAPGAPPSAAKPGPGPLVCPVAPSITEVECLPSASLPLQVPPSGATAPPTAETKRLSPHIDPRVNITEDADAGSGAVPVQGPAPCGTAPVVAEGAEPKRLSPYIDPRVNITEDADARSDVVSEQGPAPLVAANGTAPIQIPAPAAPVLNAAAGKPADEVRPASPHTKRETGRLRSAKSGDSPLPEALPARVVVTSQPAQPIPMTAALAPPPPAAARGKAADAGAGHAASRAVTGATARLIDPIAGNTPPAPTADAATALFADVKEAAKVAPEQAEPGISAPAAEAIALGARPASSHPRELQHATRTETAHVARTEPEIPARPGVLGRSLGVEIGRSIANGEETLRVRLNPPALGRIDVTIAFDDTGSLRATMSAETPRALEMLRGDSVELGRALDQAGVRADAQSFRFESRAGSGDGQSSPQRRQEAPPPARGSATSDINLIPELVYRPIRGDGRVDLLA